MDQVQLSEVSGEFLSWFQQTAQGGADFLIEQAPLYAQEVVSWVFWSNTLMAIFGVVAAVVAFLLWKKMCPPVVAAWQSHRESDCVVAVGGVFALIACVVLAMYGLLTTPMGVYGAVKAHVAPRVVIVEHMQGLLP